MNRDEIRLLFRMEFDIICVNQEYAKLDVFYEVFKVVSWVDKS